MTRQRFFLLLMALLLIVLSWWGVVTARTGLVVRQLERNGVPMLYIAPQSKEKLPGVLVAHGFAGSKQLMLGYTHVLAHAGYAVMLWDFGGHGANASPLGRSLNHELDVAYTALLEQPEVEKESLALLGHSMGSGAVMSASIRNPESFAATVAVSPTGAQVTRFAPRNLQLQAGSWEGGFVSNAERLLLAAGGENQNLASGQGRSLVIIPKAEHITILFRNASHQAALRWLDAAFGRTHTSTYVDRRMLWYGLHLLAWLLMIGVIPVAMPAIAHKSIHPLRSWGGLLVAPLVATGVLTLLSHVGEIQSLGGLMVGGAVGIWFLVAGIVWLVILFRLPRPTMRSLGLGLAFFGLLWIAFGSMAQFVWLQWWLILPRLLLLPLLSLACFPWFLASGIAQQSAGIGARLMWWLGQSTVLVVGLFLALHLLPQLSFIFLLLPLFPPLMGILSFATTQLKDVWSYALGGAMFFGWMLAAAFPLAS